MKALFAFLAGLLFGVGLALSEMVNPQKVLAFLDVSGNWDPSLALVMAGALAVAVTGFRWVLRQHKPIFASRFHLTDKTGPDRRLLMGAALFGVGWGLTGYCPGPAFAGIGLGNTDAIVMVLGIYAGFGVANFLGRKP
ncbi:MULTISPECIES: DUF6691 family protein [Methylomonas]|uniref:DUF6691 family protein n=1 Tax=Methylomonas TaxID=416 RepID=UPI001231BB91|nr:DUF6691 family protein [Methylomonas rhizoryzae]